MFHVVGRAVPLEVVIYRQSQCTHQTYHFPVMSLLHQLNRSSSKKEQIRRLQNFPLTVMLKIVHFCLLNSSLRKKDVLLQRELNLVQKNFFLLNVQYSVLLRSLHRISGCSCFHTVLGENRINLINCSLKSWVINCRSLISAE